MFGQNPEKTIIVVAPDKYKKVARGMTHELSKLENSNAAYWMIKHFEENEMQIGSKHWVLSIGNPKENKLTADYLSFIELKHEDGGLCYGFDGNKAVVFADEIKVNKNNTKSVAVGLGLINSYGVSTGAITSGIFGVGVIFGPLLNLLFVPFYFLSKYFYEKKVLEKLLKASTPLSADLFLKEGVKEWLDIYEEDKS